MLGNGFVIEENTYYDYNWIKNNTEYYCVLKITKHLYAKNNYEYGGFLYNIIFAPAYLSSQNPIKDVFNKYHFFNQGYVDINNNSYTRKQHKLNKLSALNKIKKLKYERIYVTLFG